MYTVCLLALARNLRMQINRPLVLDLTFQYFIFFTHRGGELNCEGPEHPHKFFSLHQTVRLLELSVNFLPAYFLSEFCKNLILF